MTLADHDDRVMITSTIAAMVLRVLDRPGVMIECECCLSRIVATWDKCGVLLNNSIRIQRDVLAEMVRHKDTMYIVAKDGVRKVAITDETSGWYYRLVPTRTWPALMISGVLMHRIGSTDPQRDAEQKIERLGVTKGSIMLDTCCGLGYTAMTAMRKGAKVITAEVDANVLELAELNPYSRELFLSTQIDIYRGDVLDMMESMETQGVSHIMHDPPVIGRAGELYSGALYEQLYRVLEADGTLLHYIGSPGAKQRGMAIWKAIGRRLGRIGFRRVEWLDSVKCLRAQRAS